MRRILIAVTVVLVWSAPALAQQQQDPLGWLVSAVLALLLLWTLWLLRKAKTQLQVSVPMRPDSSDDLHDELSGLPNKARLSQIVKRWDKQQRGKKAALLVCKVQHFDRVNQAIGAQNADLLLVQIAQRLQQRLLSEAQACLLDKENKVAHLGGIYFALWLDASEKQHGAEQLAHKLEYQLPQSLLIHGCAIDYQLLSGIACYPEHGEQLNELLDKALLVLQHRQFGHSHHLVYQSELTQYDQDKLSLMAELQQAIDSQQLKLHIQPQLSLTDHKVLAGEVLIRWHHPRRGLMGPDQFLPLAEQMGVIYPLTRWVLERAIQLLAQLQQQQLHCQIAVNLSSKDLLQDELVDTVELLLNKYQVPASLLILELKESALVAEPDLALRTLHHLSQLGVELALDDFGTGFSSLAYLRELPIQQVKVDCSFVFDLHRSDTHSAITGAIIDIAKNLQFTVVAEGIEQQEVEQKLLAMGCSRGQGYLYAKPFALDAFVPWMQQWGYSKASY
ncbi:bifunctional diguanylate cyclase/phosphodiesterase [Rheinheimera sp.]|uniref:putative bifunctional diguanylate cyclase/phosphodiesterase n=1 Tax=Rheinheimera sp. TaxID=1869214 RepID=UPI00307CC9AC